ncbi:hypothetical protein OG897_32430 [Streptomyces sp. NBC_00237]|uniref:hypothetical protein n=1 Tax=Streptomyces sp. NBC_00237 TaxID=2975687 RepID=UPI00225A1504|nr:hypothetical protein [Streptomyces sp. NBC_00237]MCX5206106.1 hypothetical protein [Streptomyces sp. NBC_00237]
MPLNPRFPFLAVVSATLSVPGEEGAVALAYSMPAAPFGSAAWQLPVLVGYLNRLHRRGDDPSPESFAAYAQSRAEAAVPGPAHPYPYAPWHDRRVTLLLDVSITAGNTLGWPQVSMVVQEQEPGEPCGWARTTRLHGCREVLDHTVCEISAEHARLADRTRTTPSVRGVRDLAEHTGTWIRQVRQAYRADLTLRRAAQVRTLIKG